MMKKTFSLLLATLIAVPLMAGSKALAATPQLIYTVDCDTATKDTSIRVTTDADDPQNGKEVIAFRFVFDLKPLGTTTLNDLASAKLEKNPQLSNLVIAENKSEQTATSVRMTIAGGFTEQTGVKDEILFILSQTNESFFEISVASGELYEQNSLQNFFTDSSTSKKNINPADECNPPIIIGPDTDSQSNTTPDNSSQTTSTSTDIVTTISSNASSYTPGDQVIVTASTNGTGAGSWTQTAGTQINPTITDTQITSTQRESQLVFTVPQSITTSETITLSYTIDGKTESIDVSVIVEDSGTLKNSADTSTSDLEQRIAERRDQLAENATAQIPQVNETAGNVHSAAGSLPDSGPNELLALLLISMSIFIVVKRAKSRLEF